jgi:hypothetical protein
VNPFFKIVLTAALITLISEVAKRNDRAGALIATLPIITVLTMIWLHLEKQPTSTISNHAYYTFWYVLASLPMFLALPFFLQRFDFWLALFLGVLVGLAGALLLTAVLRFFNIHLF